MATEYPSRGIFRSQVCPLTLFAKIKILAKISGFTVKQEANVSQLTYAKHFHLLLFSPDQCN